MANTIDGELKELQGQEIAGQAEMGKYRNTIAEELSAVGGVAGLFELMERQAQALEKEVQERKNPSLWKRIKNVFG